MPARLIIDTNRDTKVALNEATLTGNSTTNRPTIIANTIFAHEIRPVANFLQQK